ncbi:E3 ubiquitin/ISG15 ligase TRIM25-like [Eudromia elegans]
MAKTKEEFWEDSSLADELSCPICLSLYKSPVSLSCGHNFCKECIQRTLSAQQLSNAPYSCPMCKTQLGPILELQRNFQLCSIVETFLGTTSKRKEDERSPKEEEKEEEVIPCDFCLDQPQPAVKICLTCDSSLCQAHLNKHEAKALQSGHILVEPGAGRSAGEWRCQEHGRPLECLCENDGTYICLLCSIEGSHRSHHIITLKEAHNKSLDVLSHTVKQMQENKRALANALEKLQQSEDQLKINTKTVTSQLVKLFEESRALMNKKEENMLSNIQSNEKKHLSDIAEVKKKMEQKREEATQHLQSLQKLREQPDALLFLKEFKLIQDRIKNQNFEPEQVEVLVVEMSPNEIQRGRKLMEEYMNKVDFLLQNLHSDLKNQLQQTDSLEGVDFSFRPFGEIHPNAMREETQYKNNYNNEYAGRSRCEQTEWSTYSWY